MLAWFRVQGRPRTKGSLLAHCVKDRNHTIRYKESVEKSAYWRRLVAVNAQLDQKERHGHLLLHDGPVTVHARCFFVRPDGVTDPYPTDIHIGDTDKLARNIGDALTDSGLIRDDSQITDWDICKRWSDAGYAYADVLVIPAGESVPLGLMAVCPPVRYVP